MPAYDDFPYVCLSDVTLTSEKGTYVLLIVDVKWNINKLPVQLRTTDIGNLDNFFFDANRVDERVVEYVQTGSGVRIKLFY